ncbi:YeiH family protein [Haloprofundus sp. MHR1]|uniref:YeiH family protein n=1 Tax=Haloprofundus sp. MHR1 TaxID=2572921 RepID=UPI0010BF084A|nr:putative sulfate exporter family transporter [Haloprofundus sp. MHR1]QCJ48447.1 putative sulfate exporter family transporter [Haloprofundus sp. MHR1]
MALLAGIAVVASAVGSAVPAVDGLVLAIAGGALVANTVGVADRFHPGVALHTPLLEAGIVLLGASLSAEAVQSSGLLLVGLVTATVVSGLLFVEALSRVPFDLPTKTGSLLASGASVCGVSAAATVGGSIGVDEDQLAYVAASILLLDAVTIVVFPAVGSLLALDSTEFGVWAGLTMFSTGPVTAAGFGYDAVAGRWATLTKLLRNTFIGAVAVGYALAYAADTDSKSVAARLWSGFPTFLLGFLLLAVVANLGAFSAGQLEIISRAGDWLFALAFAGLGLEIRLEAMRDAGLKPLLVLTTYLLVVGAVALVVVTALF